jgi:hypothetical protein
MITERREDGAMSNDVTGRTGPQFSKVTVTG